MKYDSTGKVKWVKSGGGGFVGAVILAVDKQRNIYFTGIISDSKITFEDTIISGVQRSYFFVLKFNSVGKLVLIKTSSGDSHGSIYSWVIKADAAENIYLAGEAWADTIRFDTIELTHKTTTKYHTDIYLVKYNKDGEAQWAKRGLGLGYNNSPTGVAINKQGDIFILGNFLSDSLIFDNVILKRKGVDRDIFLVKYNYNGKLLWAKNFGRSSQDAPAMCMASDTNGDILIAGYYYGKEMVLDSIHITNTFKSGARIFIAKLNANGEAVWAKSAGGEDDWNRSNTIAVDALNNIYLSGEFKSKIAYFGNDSLVNKSTYTSDVFLAKLSNATTGISNPTPPHQNHSATLYPNPTRQTITINTQQIIQKTEVFNLAGMLVSSATLQNEINVEALPKGMYFIKIYTAQGVQAAKFVRE
ncbi:MAG: T9SS type A sorting domain-containing protein [Bacteroidetes bacterium]|nr:T9SS type A sorting domain-containing protein [Bacteroidota bacterium]